MDPALIQAMLAGREEAFREVVAVHEKGLFNFILRYTGDRTRAEDLLQDTFLKMLRGLPGYRPQAAFKTWLYTIARNLCLDHLKYRRRHPVESLDAPIGSAEGNILYFADILKGGGTPPDQEAIGAEAKARLRRAIDRLDPLKREAILLRVFHDLPYEEVARIVGAPVGTVKFRVHEAVRELARTMGEARDEGRDTGTNR